MMNFAKVKKVTTPNTLLLKLMPALTSALTSMTTLTVMLTLILATLFTSSANTASAANIVMEKADALQPVKGFFSQSKNIKPLKRPFKSQGSFVYWPNKGLLWHTQKPIDSIKLFANDGVYKVNGQGVLVKEAQLDNEFFLALFSADQEKLTRFFIIESLPNNAADGHSLCLALTPLSETMQSLFKTINLCMSEDNNGGRISSVEPKAVPKRMPSKIELIEANGNNTEINLQLSSESISAKELAYFD
ncbi:MAG: outer membrane lipoprotein carrier protein LolA [Colwellia sp.]|uniref:outer membrane lipoprotein carrier protein LolA n=1 Tax=Colwellia sp. TaxID=56799 RepID=UPI0025BD1881|nr:outer membrane lipoprotein carrier protein LolA [Colwellia sp.]NQZ28148.1 outer membrane lipoprotein carrier protein LolA [Colwellia sp.]